LEPKFFSVRVAPSKTERIGLGRVPKFFQLLEASVSELDSIQKRVFLAENNYFFFKIKIKMSKRRKKNQQGHLPGRDESG